MNTELIINYMQTHDLTKTAFAKMCDISLSKLNTALAGSCRVKATTLIKIVTAMGIRSQELLGV